MQEVIEELELQVWECLAVLRGHSHYDDWIDHFGAAKGVDFAVANQLLGGSGFDGDNGRAVTLCRRDVVTVHAELQEGRPG